MASTSAAVLAAPGLTSEPDMPRPTTPAHPVATAIAALAVASCISAAAAQPTPLVAVRIAENLADPVWCGSPRGDKARLFILERAIPSLGHPTTGRIRILDLRTNTLAPDPFLSIYPIGNLGEAGLLGIAFHPGYLENGYFWVNYTDVSGHTVIARYRALGDPRTATTADPASAQIALLVPDPSLSSHNHNAGWMDFGPDGMLYIATGDGNSSGTPQSLNSLRGKILRIDVDGPDNTPGNTDDDDFPDDPMRLYSVPPDNPFAGDTPGLDEIWAYGLRNPWRNGFDPLTGDLFIADVGNNEWEEVNFQPAHIPGAMPGDPGYVGGRNYGWPFCEGFDGCGAGLPGVTLPFLVYGHTDLVPPLNVLGRSVTGGAVYRGCAVPDLQGAYFFADHSTRQTFSLRYDGATITDIVHRTAELTPPGDIDIRTVHFGFDDWGELYLVSLSENRIYKVIPAAPHDVNGDNVADICRCPADWNGNNATDSTDISAFLTAWLAAVVAGTNTADYNADGQTTSTDISAFLTSWLAALDGGC